MSKYWVPVQSSRVEFEVKKSRFIGFACKVDTREQALQALQDEKKLFPDARHHCWAYQIGAPWSPHTAAMNDDGEPNGTAGKPILNVIQHKGISHVMVVVSRYFGGVKLGAGGLVRAYSNSAEQALSTLAVSEFEPMVKVHVSCPFSEEQWLRHWLAQHEVVSIEGHYQEQVTLAFVIPKRLLKPLRELAEKPDFKLILPQIDS